MTSAQVRALAWLASQPPFAGYAYAIQLRLADLLIITADLVRQALRYAQPPDEHPPMLTDLELRAHRALVNYDLHRQAYERRCAYGCGLRNGEHGAGLICKCGCPRSHHTKVREVEPRTAEVGIFEDGVRVRTLLTGDPKYIVAQCYRCARPRWGEPVRYGDGLCSGFETDEGAELCIAVRRTQRAGAGWSKHCKLYGAPTHEEALAAQHAADIKTRETAAKARREETKASQGGFGFYEPPPQAPRRGRKARLPGG